LAKKNSVYMIILVILTELSDKIYILHKKKYSDNFVKMTDIII
jgi:hypothetical protein